MKEHSSPKTIINELMKVDAIKKFYSQSDMKTINRMIVTSYYMLGQVKPDDVEYVLATWATFGNLDKINDETVAQSIKSKENDFHFYLRFKKANQLMMDKFIKMAKKIQLAQIEVEDPEVRDHYFARHCAICIALLLSGRLFFIASNQ